MSAGIPNVWCIAQHEQVGGRLAGGVGAARRQRRRLGEQAGRPEAAVDLVGGDLDEALDGELAGGVEQDLRAQHVGADERPGVEDAAIDVALGREVDDVAHAEAEGGRGRRRGR